MPPDRARAGVEPRCGRARGRHGYALRPVRAQRGDERLPLLERDLRIAIALEHEVAVEHAVVDAARRRRPRSSSGSRGPSSSSAAKVVTSFMIDAGFIGSRRLVQEQRLDAGADLLHVGADTLSAECRRRGTPRATARGSAGVRQSRAATQRSTEHGCTPRASCAHPGCSSVRSRQQARIRRRSSDVGRHEVHACCRSAAAAARAPAPRAKHQRAKSGRARVDLERPDHAALAEVRGPCGCAASGCAERVAARRAFAVASDDVVVAKDVEHRERGAARERVAGIRMRMQEPRAVSSS